MITTTTPALGWHAETGQLDLQAAPASRLTWLQNAVTISLFTDARASRDEAPQPNDLRGYWGDTELPDQQSLGSKLWLLQREKVTQSVINRARDYCQQALQWLLDEQHLQTIEVGASRDGLDRIHFQIKCQLNNGEWLELFPHSALTVATTGDQ